MDAEKKSSRTMVVSTDEYQALVERVQALEAEVRRLRERLEKASEVRAFREARIKYQGREPVSASSKAEVEVVIPKSVLVAANMSVQELRTELAVHLFERDKLSFGKARELAGMNVWDFMQLLGSRGIPIHYDVEEYEEDLATLDRLSRR